MSNHNFTKTLLQPTITIDCTKWPTPFLRRLLEKPYPQLVGFRKKFLLPHSKDNPVGGLIERLVRCSSEERETWFKLLKKCAHIPSCYRNATIWQKVIEKHFNDNSTQTLLEFYLWDNLINCFFEAIDLAQMHSMSDLKIEELTKILPPKIIHNLDTVAELLEECHKWFERYVNHPAIKILIPMEDMVFTLWSKSLQLRKLLNEQGPILELDRAFTKVFNAKYRASNTFAVLLRTQYLAEIRPSYEEISRLTSIMFNEGQLYVDDSGKIRSNGPMILFEERLKKVLAGLKAYNLRPTYFTPKRGKIS